MLPVIFRSIDEDLDTWVEFHHERVILSLIAFNYVMFFVYYFTKMLFILGLLITSLLLTIGIAWSYNNRLSQSFREKCEKEQEEEQELVDDDESHKVDELQTAVKRRFSLRLYQKSLATNGASENHSDSVLSSLTS
jgi:hypothetical protein